MPDEYSTSPMHHIPKAASRAWLEHFPVTSRFRVGLWFNLTFRDYAPQDAAQLIARVRQRVIHHIQSSRDPHYTDACLVFKALDEDPAGALAYAQAVIKYQKLPPEARERLKAARSETYRRTAMARKQPSDPQLELLQSLHYEGPEPANMLEASCLIDALLRR